MKWLVSVALVLVVAAAAWWGFFAVARVTVAEAAHTVVPPSMFDIEMHGRRVAFDGLPAPANSLTDVQIATSVSIQLKNITTDREGDEVYFATGTTTEGHPATLIRDGDTFSLTWIEVQSGRRFRHDLGTGETPGELYHDVEEVFVSGLEGASGEAAQESTPCSAWNPKVETKPNQSLIIDVVAHVRRKGYQGQVKFGVQFLEAAMSRLRGVSVDVRLQPADSMLPQHFGGLWRFAKINSRFVAGDLCAIETAEVCDYYRTVAERGSSKPHLIIFVSDREGADCGFSASTPSAKQQMRNYAVVSARCASTSMLHEAGHLLGLQHEFWWDPRLYTLTDAAVVTSGNVVPNRPYIWTEEGGFFGFFKSGPRQVGTTMCRSCEQVMLSLSESGASCNGKRIGERGTKSDDVTVASKIAIDLIAEHEIRPLWDDDGCRINTALQCAPVGQRYVSFRTDKSSWGDRIGEPAVLPLSDPRVVLLTGFASQGSGTAAYNASLSRRRLETARGQLEKQFPKASFQLCVMGADMAPCSKQGKPLRSDSDTQAVYVLEQTEFADVLASEK